MAEVFPPQKHKYSSNRTVKLSMSFLTLHKKNVSTDAHCLVGASFRGYQDYPGYQAFSFEIILCVYPLPGTYAKVHMYMKFCSMLS